MTDSSPVPTDDLAPLVQRAARGDVSAYEQLYTRCAGRVFAICVRMTGDRQRARELTHDAFVRAWERLGSFRGQSGFETWMHRLAVNVVLVALRTDRRREARVALADDLAPDATSTARVVSAPDVGTRIDLERAIAALPASARAVLVLHDIEGYRHDEIAVRLALAPGTVRSQLHRARKLLMRMLNR